MFIEFFRSTNKESTLLVKMKREGWIFCTSSIVQYEVLCGTEYEHLDFWKNIFDCIEVFPFGRTSVDKARDIYRSLKKNNKLIEVRDILIAAAAAEHKLPLVTLNTEHFKRIADLVVWGNK
ncbi:MAG: type II toxin-antitoxin system VapC family toxin [Planctomycetaceae bacterium]|nr:type II toxin-antitoxin system VapC family toxin [Planctomycetaceae bacterium]